MHIPFLGRLLLPEYGALIFGLLLLVFEAVARIVTMLLPQTVEQWLYQKTRSAFHAFARSPYKANDPLKVRAEQIRTAKDFDELCAIYGYTPEEHLVQTKDGYLLVVHRLPCRKGEVKARPGTPTGKPVVYLHHGLLMCSEIWVCLTDEERCIPFVLAEAGYDVWLGNNRGNKYSRKSVHHTPADTAFWRFSMDEFCMHDIPDTISYILDTTQQPSLGYVGFSQGTAQAFAALSVLPQLNQKVNVFVAVAPAMSPPGLSNRIVDALMKASPSLMFLLFGRRSILSSTTFWQSMLYPPLFCMVIDRGLKFLFDWQCLNIAPAQKMAAYAHLYSFTSTKSVVHWFQIMRRAVFQLYDDDVAATVRLYGQSFYHPAKFPTQNIATPIVLLYGTHDSLVDIKVMKAALPDHTVAIGIPAYEHVDMIWGKDVDKLIIPHVLEALDGGRKGRKMAITNGTT
ncbi:alpha/beta-hydrolase [Exidia glandulosa HHB12029]|uniref:Alpha/beta-hydrolase n=1 Tax=Exidia glandulosa HHB12029 TaxID=1314781 RepID=A0A165B6S2_EXIGL|nr:alpha/beta-hydrolase [Exidia glandulosa HHB12029]